MTIYIDCHAVPGSATATGSNYVAETTCAGVRYEAQSRHGASAALARILVEAQVPDAPVKVRHAATRGHMSYASLHGMAGFTYSEGHTPLKRVRWAALDRHVAFSGAPVALPPPAFDAPVAAAPALSVSCPSCGESFAPRRSTAKFCSSACRLVSHRTAEY
jgi:hypothetical protein